MVLAERCVSLTVFDCAHVASTTTFSPTISSISCLGAMLLGLVQVSSTPHRTLVEDGFSCQRGWNLGLFTLLEACL